MTDFHLDDETIPDNSMFLMMTILDDGDLRVAVGHKFASDLSTEEAYQYSDLLNGLNTILAMAPEMVMHFGTLARRVVEYEEEYDDGDELVFEPAEELQEAIAEAKIVNLKDRMN
jgi:hypothetical protein